MTKARVVINSNAQILYVVEILGRENMKSEGSDSRRAKLIEMKEIEVGEKWIASDFQCAFDDL